MVFTFGSLSFQKLLQFWRGGFQLSVVVFFFWQYVTGFLEERRQTHTNNYKLAQLQYCGVITSKCTGILNSFNSTWAIPSIRGIAIKIWRGKYKFIWFHSHSVPPRGNRKYCVARDKKHVWHPCLTVGYRLLFVKYVFDPLVVEEGLAQFSGEVHVYKPL